MVDKVPTDDTTGSETTIEDAVKAEDYSTYEKLRQAASTSTAVPPVNRDDTDAPPDETGEESAEDSDDGSADAGSQKAAKKAKDSLPAGVKKRLERERRKAEVARKEAAEWKRRFEESQSAASRSEEEKPEEEVEEPKAEAGDEPLPQDQYDAKYDYPDEADYGTDTDDGLSAFLEDIDRWERNIPLQGGKWADGGPAETEDTGARGEEPPEADDPEPQDTGPIDDGEPDPDQIIQQQFEDLREALEEAEGSNDDLAQDFFDQLQSDKFKLSPEMLEWLADHDDAAKVAAMFVKAPRKANRIFRAPKSKHAQLLAELAEGSADEEEVPPTRAKDNRSGKPVVGELNGRRPRDPNKRLANAKSYDDYESLRRELSPGAR